MVNGGADMLDKMALSNFNELEDKNAVMVLSHGSNLEDSNLDIIKELMTGPKECLYVTVNQPFKRMEQMMKKKGIDTSRVFFIDCITLMSGGKTEDAENCVFLDSPGNLTELSISISEAIKSMGENKILFIDALSTFIIYNKPKSFSRFAHFAMTNVKSNNMLGIFLVVEGEMEEELYSQLEQFSDEVIDLR